MAKITVSSAAYVHTEDIDPDKVVDAEKVEAAVKLCVARAVAALDEPANDYGDFQRANVASVINSMYATHRAIRRVLSFGWEKPESVEALTLARVSLEGLYGLCLMFEDAKYVDVYLRDGWKKSYVKFLLQREETKNLPRFTEYSKKTGPTALAVLRVVMGITDAEQATIEHEELGTPMRAGTAISRIPKFPTPGGVIDLIAPGDRRKMLERLYPEYQRLCTFAHGLPDANLMKNMFNKDSKYKALGLFSDEDIEDTFRREVAERSFTFSVLSIGQSAAELTLLYPANVDLAAAVVDTWKEISQGMLLGRVVWNIRTKKLLGIVDAAPAPQARPNA